MCDVCIPTYIRVKKRAGYLCEMLRELRAAVPFLPEDCHDRLVHTFSCFCFCSVLFFHPIDCDFFFSPSSRPIVASETVPRLLDSNFFRRIDQRQTCIHASIHPSSVPRGYLVATSAPAVHNGMPMSVQETPIRARRRCRCRTGYISHVHGCSTHLAQWISIPIRIRPHLPACLHTYIHAYISTCSTGEAMRCVIAFRMLAAASWLGI
jgi:hypothetical protein